MIRKENLEEMLKVIGYVRDAHKKIYEKRYADFDCVIEVDFTGSGSIRYPEDKGMKITRKTTCNFSDPENFVVLECITRLMIYQIESGLPPNTLSSILIQRIQSRPRILFVKLWHSKNENSRWGNDSLLHRLCF